jgi:hypothetical protein
MVKFLTDGMLVQEMMADPLLTQYSVIMVDDMHERSLNTDMILGLLKKSNLLYLLGSGGKGRNLKLLSVRPRCRRMRLWNSLRMRNIRRKLLFVRELKSTILNVEGR